MTRDSIRGFLIIIGVAIVAIGLVLLLAVSTVLRRVPDCAAETA